MTENHISPAVKEIINYRHTDWCFYMMIDRFHIAMNYPTELLKLDTILKDLKRIMKTNVHFCHIEKLRCFKNIEIQIRSIKVKIL